jgi:RNA polymerase sigma-70 factor (ECF subfamily)
MNRALREIFKDSYSNLFASLYTRFPDIDLVEDGIQDAFEKALSKWEDPPRDPSAWLYVTAKNRILDLLKRKSREAVEFQEESSGGAVRDIEIDEMDQQLRLMCFCCHPALAERVQILLTLKLVVGLTTEEIAAALVMKSKTVGQSLTRAKRKIAKAGIPFQTPDMLDLSARIPSIQGIIYLMFNEGYHSNSEHSLYRVDLCNEAIRLARILCDINGPNAESSSLLALMLFQHSRSRARSDSSGEPVLLADQNRKLWDSGMIGEAGEILEGVVRGMEGPPGRYLFQAAIAQKYAVAPSFEESDWAGICRIYAEYYYSYPDPIVLLSWITAESYRSDARTALGIMAETRLESHLRDYRWFYSTRAELLAKIGEHRKAVADLEKSLSLTANPGEKRMLMRRISELSDD